MRKLTVVFVVLGIVTATGWWLTPPALVSAAKVPEIPTDIDAWLEMSERAVSSDYALIPGTEKRIRWQQTGARTEYAIVYLHGFSATRQEIAPTNELVADRLNANLYEARLAGHGHGRLPMDQVRAEQWLDDGVEAIRIGAALGDKVIVIGTSTGATLALALNGHRVMKDVATFVFISPNIAPADSSAAWLTGPAGPQLARWLNGDTRSWIAHNDLQERFWSTSYPMDAIIEVMRLVDTAERLTGNAMRQDVLMLLSPNDTVISPQAARAAFEKIDAPRKELIEIVSAGDPSNHVLAGDILSPDNTQDVVEHIVGFIVGRR